jgi:hypothetical protein
MNNPGIRPECEELLSALEELNIEERVTEAEVLSSLSIETRQHAVECQDCRSAVEDFVATRAALAAMKATLPEPGPWFGARVMAAAQAAEKDIEEKKDGVWISVRRLAPRLAAFAALLLVLGGTWAMEVRRREATLQGPEMRPAEGLFETTPSAVTNDDIVASSSEGVRP